MQRRARALVTHGVPSTCVQAGVLFAAVAAVLLVRAVDNDYWWHIRTGRYVLANGVPATDPFSWSAAGRPWVAHEWLAEVVMYVLGRAVGYAAELAIFASIGLLALVVAYACARALGAGSRVLVLLLAISSLTLAMFLTVRPQVFSWFLFAVFLALIIEEYEGRRRRAAVLPVLMAIWANLHLGFVFGLLLVGCWVAAAVWERRRGGGVGPWRPAVIAGACVLAASLNPSGPELLLYPLRYLTDAGVTRSQVAEWQRPDITFPFHAPIFLTAVLLALSTVVSPRPRAFYALVAVVTVGLSMSAVRHAPFAAVALLPIAGPAIAGRQAWARAAADATVRLPAPLAAALVGATFALVATVAVGRNGRAVSLRAPSTSGYPEAAAEYVRQHDAGRRLWNDYNSGAFLIDRLYPDVRVFVDGRTDFYGDRFLSDYLRTQQADPGWQRVFDRYAIDVALVPADVPLAAALAGEPGWTRVYADAEFLVFERS